jgi:hypothetical protein
VTEPIRVRTAPSPPSAPAGDSRRRRGRPDLRHAVVTGAFLAGVVAGYGIAVRSAPSRS